MKHEIRKLCNNRIILLGLAVTICFSLYCAYDRNKSYEAETLNTGLVEDTYKGTYTEEKYNMLEEKLASLGQEDEEFYVYLSMCSKARSYRDTLAYRQNVLKSAARLKNSQDTYVSRTNSRIEEIFMEIPQLELEDTGEIDEVTGLFKWGTSGDIINIMLIIFASSYIFTIEHSANTHKLVFSSYAGRMKTYVRKISCIACMAFGLSIMTSICYCFFAAISGNGAVWMLPVQCNSEFMYAPYVINLLQYVLIVTFLRGVGFVLVGVCSAVISLFFKKSIISVILNSVVMAGGYMLCTYFAEYSPTGTSIIQSRYEMYMKIKQYTFIGLINDSGFYLQKYMPVDVFDYPVDMVYINVFVNVIFLAVVALAGGLIYRKRDA